MGGKRISIDKLNNIIEGLRNHEYYKDIAKRNSISSNTVRNMYTKHNISSLRKLYKKSGLCKKCSIKLTNTNRKTYSNQSQSFVCTQCISKKEIERKRKIKIETIKQYGGMCICCGERTIEFLTIHHVNNNGTAHRREIKAQHIWQHLRLAGYPKCNFVLLCFNCNCAKGYFGYCPHEIQQQKNMKKAELELELMNKGG